MNYKHLRHAVAPVSVFALAVIAGCGGGESRTADEARTSQRQAPQSVPDPGNPIYVDSVGGNDSNPGTQQLPWRTLRQVTQFANHASAIYLKADSTWAETLVLTAANLQPNGIVGAYGGTQAIITGAEDFSTGWTSSPSGVWSRPVPAGTPAITQLYLNGARQRMARWPNFVSTANDYSGTQSAPDTPGTDPASMFVSSTDWNTLKNQNLTGATIWTKSKPWYINTQTISSAAPQAAASGVEGKLVLQPVQDSNAPAPVSSEIYAVPRGVGYILSGKRWMIDLPGEFAHDTVANVLYLYPGDATSRDKLNLSTVTGTTRPLGISITGVPGVQISSITTRMTARAGVLLTDVGAAVLSNLNVTDNQNLGLQISGSSNGSTIQNSSFARNAYQAITIPTLKDTKVLNNTVLDTGTTYAGASNYALEVGPGAKVSGNYINGSAKGGIRFSSTAGATQVPSDISNNKVVAVCLRYSDCGGIYTWNGAESSPNQINQASSVINNLVFNVPGNLNGNALKLDGSGGPEDGGAVNGIAIYLDDGTQNTLVSGNTVADNTVGVMLHNTRNVTVDSNKIWRSTGSALALSHDTALIIANTERFGYDNKVTNNQLNGVAVLTRGNKDLPTYGALGVATRPGAMINYLDEFQSGNAPDLVNNQFSGNTFLMLNGTSREAAVIKVAGNATPLSIEQWRTRNVFPTHSEGAVQHAAEYVSFRPILDGAELNQDLYFTNALLANPSPSAWSFYLADATNESATLASDARFGPTAQNARYLNITATTPYSLFRSPSFNASAGLHSLTFKAGFFADTASGRGFEQLFVGSVGVQDLTIRSGAKDEMIAYQGYFNFDAPASGIVKMAAATTNPLPLPLKVGVNNMSIRKVLSYSVSKPSDWSAVAYATPTTSTVNCATYGWPTGCTVADATTGAPVAFPLTLQPNEARFLVRTNFTGGTDWRATN